jgi:hypothetical protein
MLKYVNNSIEQLKKLQCFHIIASRPMYGIISVFRYRTEDD